MPASVVGESEGLWILRVAENREDCSSETTDFLYLSCQFVNTIYIYINIIANIDTIWYISILSYTAVNFWFLSASMSRYVGHETPPCSVFSTRLMSAEHSNVQIVRQQLVPLHYLPWPTSSQFFAGQIQDSEIMKLNSWTVEHPKNWIEKVFCSIFFII